MDSTYQWTGYLIFLLFIFILHLAFLSCNSLGSFSFFFSVHSHWKINLSFSYYQTGISLSISYKSLPHLWSLSCCCKGLPFFFSRIRFTLSFLCKHVIPVEVSLSLWMDQMRIAIIKEAYKCPNRNLKINISTSKIHTSIYFGKQM